MLGPPDRGWVARSFASPPLLALGRVSYGVYLWQELVLYDWLRLTGQRVFTPAFVPTLAVVAAITIAIATLSWLVVEQPLLRRAG